MSTRTCKGCALKATISGTLTAIAQIINFDLGDIEGETYEADTLDNASAGIPYAPTGRVEGGKVSGELFFDYNLGSHAGYVGLIGSGGVACAASFPQTTSFNAAFTAAGFGLGLTVALKEGLKGKFSIKISGQPVFAAGS
ncbi:MAG: hypothetical protein ABSG68_26825 [Thermoguttaceae bacterium]|jgi:hypothetical protein